MINIDKLSPQVRPVAQYLLNRHEGTHLTIDDIALAMSLPLAIVRPALLFCERAGIIQRVDDTHYLILKSEVSGEPLIDNEVVMQLKKEVERLQAELQQARAEKVVADKKATDMEQAFSELNQRIKSILKH
ncbi:hypothetical protein [Thaumasiovibrio sp. DFM-14]|uniref:hypothetical protein n=1 Tax=Thaumasiovibrio sp. DFM-14 TaxID=3384792 RepID=UPI0039A093EB